MSWSSTTTEPGDEVTLRVDVAEPDSLVGILVVDKATQFAGSQHDITKNTVRTAVHTVHITSFTLDLSSTDMLPEQRDWPCVGGGQLPRRSSRGRRCVVVLSVCADRTVSDF